MESFFVMIIGGFTQYKYAWYDTISERCNKGIATDFPACEFCGSPVGSLRWVGPYEVDLKQPRKVGDFLTGASGPSFLASEKYFALLENENLTGVERIFPVKVRNMGTTRKSKSYNPPNLFGVDILHTSTRVDFDKMGVEWSKPPADNYCRHCGPGGGGNKGYWRKIERVVVNLDTWEGEDFFFAINFAGFVLVSSKAAKLIGNAKLENVTLVPCEEFSYSFSG